MDVLGFSCGIETPDYSNLHRDAVRIMLAAPNAHGSWNGASFTGQIYISLEAADEVDALWEAVKDRAAVIYAVDDFEYGAREFGIRDDNGYALAFGAPSRSTARRSDWVFSLDRGHRIGWPRKEGRLAIPDGHEVARRFLPTRDFESSRAFYEALGFEKRLDSDVAIFGIGGTSFILGRHYQQDWAGNFMMQLMVDDLDAWWVHIQALDLAVRFGVPAPKAPEVQSWGLRVAYVVDPAGVLWHVAQRRPDKPQDR